MQRGRRDGINQQLLAAGEQAEPTAAAEGHGDAEGIQRDGPVQAVVHRPGANHTEKLRPEVAHDVDDGERHRADDAGGSRTACR